MLVDHQFVVPGWFFAISAKSLAFVSAVGCFLCLALADVVATSGTVPSIVVVRLVVCLVDLVGAIFPTIGAIVVVVAAVVLHVAWSVPIVPIGFAWSPVDLVVGCVASARSGVASVGLVAAVGSAGVA